MIELRTSAEIAAMRQAGSVVARTLQAVQAQARPGVSLQELDELARTVIEQAGAAPVFFDYRPRWAPSPFPGVICASVNDVIVHGIPGPQRLAAGDLVSIDCGASVDGWCGDAAVTFAVGECDRTGQRLLTAAHQALEDGVAAAVAGARIGDISHAIGVVGRSYGYGIPTPLGGHGIGRSMHEPPFIANEGHPGRGSPLRPGMVVAIEPIFVAGGRDSFLRGEDGWSLYSDDGSRAAHVEHTIAVTEQGPRLLTVT